MAYKIVYAVCILLSGIGVFMYACNMISDTFCKVSNKTINKLLLTTSHSKLLGVLIGTISTAILQSSGAVSVMVIGFLGANIMTLSQATAIILGANIGTTVTGQLTALGLVASSISIDVIFASFILVGVIIGFVAKKESAKRVAYVFIGFGMMFLGLHLMSNSMNEFKDLEVVKSTLWQLDNPIALIIVGTLVTSIIQSSSVVTSISITMTACGLMTLDQGIYLTMGANIGSCMVGVIASIGKCDNAKRIAYINVMFNVIGVVLFYLIDLIMRVTTSNGLSFGIMLKSTMNGNIAGQLALFHTLFNIINVAIMLPFTSFFVNSATKCLTTKQTNTSKEKYETSTCKQQHTQTSRNSRNTRR